MMDTFIMRNADIRRRGDDTSLKTYLNRRYPTVRAADPNHVVEYLITFYLTDIKEETNHIVKHHEMMKTLLDESNFVKTLYVNVHSWMKHFLFDRSIQFDVFSGYEIQLLFL